MELNLDAVIETPENSVDMKTGLDTFQGLSEATRTIVETILTDNVPQRNSARSKIRSKMKQSFKGSYGLKFSIESFDEDALRKFKGLGRKVVVELIQYYLSEVLYENYPTLSPKAQRIIDNLEEKSEELVSRLRGGILEDVHKITNNFGYTVKLRHRISRDNITEIQTFNDETALVLVPQEDTSIQDLEVSITRFNIYTGNGRLQLDNSDETIAFGFKKYKQISKTAKRQISQNLSDNTALNADEDMKLLSVRASCFRNSEGKVIKYWITKLI